MSTQIPAAKYALGLVLQGKTIKQAADEIGCEPGEVLRELLDEYRGTARGKPAAAAAEDTLQRSLQHPSGKVRKAAERLAAVLQEEDGKADLLRRRAALEAELAKVKAELRGTSRGGPKASLPCPDCDRVLPNPQGLALHRKAKHPPAVAA